MTETTQVLVEAVMKRIIQNGIIVVVALFVGLAGILIGGTLVFSPSEPGFVPRFEPIDIDIGAASVRLAGSLETDRIRTSPTRGRPDCRSRCSQLSAIFGKWKIIWASTLDHGVGQPTCGPFRDISAPLYWIYFV